MTKENLDWFDLDTSVLPEVYRKKFDAAADAIRVANAEVREAIEFYLVGIADQIPTGKELRVNYKWGKYGAAFADKRGRSLSKNAKALIPKK